MQPVYSVLSRLHQLQRHFIDDRQSEHPAKPAQIIHPVPARNFIDGFPALRTGLRFPPGTEGQGGNSKINRSQMLRRTQRNHPGIGFPRSFEAFTVLINNHNIGDPFTQQAKGRT
ncbi:hypothetical protein D3C80_1828900 [compost metagenome]